MNKEARFSYFVAALGIIFLIILCSSHQHKAYGWKSVFNGTWTITFSDCQGNKTVYEDCKVSELNEQFVTFTWGGRSAEIKLPVFSGCSLTIMERVR